MIEKIKWYSLALLLFVVILFSGCSVKEEANRIIKDNGLDKAVTTVCYDYFDKKPCPKGTLQYDIDLCTIIPSTSRFCFGFTDDNSSMPIGMKCYRRDLVK